MSATVLEPEAPGATTMSAGLFRSVGKFVTTLIALAQTRLELLSNELREEVRRATELLVWSFMALLAGAIGLLLAGLTVIFALWETHRIAAAIIVTLTFLSVSALSFTIVRRRVRDRPRMFDATRSELERDKAQFTEHA